MKQIYWIKTITCFRRKSCLTNHFLKEMANKGKDTYLQFPFKGGIFLFGATIRKGEMFCHGFHTFLFLVMSERVKHEKKSPSGIKVETPWLV